MLRTGFGGRTMLLVVYQVYVRPSTLDSYSFCIIRCIVAWCFDFPCAFVRQHFPIDTLFAAIINIANVI